MVTLRSLDDQIHFHLKDGHDYTVGRLPKCDLVLEDGSVSSQHARLQLADNRLRIVDTGSTNGTRVNYAMLSAPGYLMDGDTVEFGNVTFVVDGPKLESPAQASQSLQALVDLDPLEASQPLEDTMLNIPVPSEQDLEAYDGGGERPESRGEEEVVEEPTHASFLTALALTLAAGLILVAVLWTYTPRF